MPDVVLTLCGRVAVTLDGAPPPGPPLGGKCLALLAFLALEAGPHSREELTALLWGDFPEGRARASMRQALTHLRRALGDVVRVDRAFVSLDRGVRCDVHALERGAVRDRDRLLAVDVRGFLAGLPVRHCTAFDEWAEGRRLVLLERAQEALGGVAREALARRAWSEAVDVAERWLALDPLAEEAVRVMVEGRYLGGERDAALAAYAAYRRRLAGEAAREPGRALRQLVERVERDTPGPAPARATDEWYATAPAFEPSLRGRAAEWDALHRAWKGAAAGRGRVVLVGGEAGTGKSRLADDFVRWVSASGGVVLRGRGFEASGGVPFGPMVEALRSAVDAPALAGADPEWLAEVARLVPELRRRFTSLPAPPDATPDRWRLFEGVAQLLLALADEDPVAVLLDDLQWYDADSCALLHVLVRRLESAPVLWCATMTLGATEPEAQPARLYRALRARQRTTVLTLAPLGEDDVWQMVRELGHVTAPNAGRRIAGRIHEVTGGNPFYVIELLKTLFAQGWLTVDPATGEWLVSATDSDGALSLSRTVHDAIAPRIECLPNDLRAVLITIAVADRGCRTDVLSRVHGISRLHAAALGDALLERHLAVEEGGTYRCAHPVIARVVRDGLTTARRREVHREIAFALVLEAPPGAEPADPGEIARHAEQGGEAALAYRYAMMATRAGVTRYAYDEALSWLDLAAGVAPTPADANAVDGATAELLRLVGASERPSAPRWPTAAVGVLERGDLDLPARA